MPQSAAGESHLNGKRRHPITDDAAKQTRLQNLRNKVTSTGFSILTGSPVGRFKRGHLMKLKSLALSLLITAAPLASYAADHLIPAGSLVSCTVSEPKLSSKTTAIGDPILCQLGHVEMYGRSQFPANAYLEGRFEDFKDPGHFVGKGWMELKFDRMIIQPDTVIPVSAKVVYVPGYPVSRDGRIDGKGHPVRDTIEWMIPVLWPIDLINLPRRGPRPVLKAETRITLKIMDDLVVPQNAPEPPHDDYGFAHRAPSSYEPPPPAPEPPPQPIAYVPAPEYLAPPPPPVVLIMQGGYNVYATHYWYPGAGQFRYTAMNGVPYVIPFGRLDLGRTIAANRERGVGFYMPPRAF